VQKQRGWRERGGHAENEERRGGAQLYSAAAGMLHASAGRGKRPHESTRTVEWRARMADREPCGGVLAGERNGCLCCGELPSEPGEGPLDRQPTDNICLCLRVALLCITVICNVAVRTTVPRLLFSYILVPVECPCVATSIQNIS
jgi:hypothetical protein